MCDLILALTPNGAYKNNHLQLEYQIINFAIKKNFHIRIGFENNLSNTDGTQAKNNEQRVVDTIKLIKNISDYQSTRIVLTADWYEY